MDTSRGPSRRGVSMLVAVALLVFLVIARITGFDLQFIRDTTSHEAEISRAKADIKAWEVNLIRYKTRYYELLTQAQGLEVLTDPPKDGNPQIAKVEMLKDPWGHPYQYRSPGKHHPESYDLFSLGADGVEDTLDDIGNW